MKKKNTSGQRESGLNVGQGLRGLPETGFLGGPLFRGSLWPGNCAACGNLPHRRRLGTNPGRRSWSAEDARRPSDVRGDAQGPGTW